MNTCPDQKNEKAVYESAVYRGKHDTQEYVIRALTSALQQFKPLTTMEIEE